MSKRRRAEEYPEPSEFDEDGALARAAVGPPSSPAGAWYACMRARAEMAVFVDAEAGTSDQKLLAQTSAG